MRKLKNARGSTSQTDVQLLFLFQNILILLKYFNFTNKKPDKKGILQKKNRVKIQKIINLLLIY